MRRILYTMAMAAGMLLMPAGATYAEDCTLEAKAPVIPDGSTVTEEEVEAVKKLILDYQKALAPYRECLDATVKNTELEKDVRQAALDAYNASVDAETAVVENWQKMMTAYKAR